MSSGGDVLQPAVKTAWSELGAAVGVKEDHMIPVTYVNSSANAKGFVGEHGGSVCTSSDAEQAGWKITR